MVSFQAFVIWKRR